MKISYSKKGDYYIPNLIPPKNKKGFQLGKYNTLRLQYLKEHKKAKYHSLVMENELKIKDNITEELKAKDQMEWVKRMNNISNIADEIVLNMYVYDNEN